MVAIYHRMLSYFILPLLLVICESFPYVKEGSLGRMNTNDDSYDMDDNVSKIRTEINQLFSQDQTSRRLSSDKAIGTMGYTELDNTNGIDSSLNSVQSRTENAINNLINSYMSTKTKMQSNNLKPVRQDGKKVKLRNFKTLDHKLKTRDFSSAKRKQSKVHSKVLPKISRTDQTLSEDRQRRSYKAEDTFHDEGGVIYLAHTADCDSSDKHYCRNGGTCLYIPALQARTCR